MGSDVYHLSSKMIALWDSYDLFPSYPESKEKSKAYIRSKVNKAFRLVQSNFFHRFGDHSFRKLEYHKFATEASTELTLL